jgi:aryl-alcohol dehydrogenase-like predicted oxidoreductase
MAKLGNLDVSAIGLGCNNFGRALDAEGSAVVVNAALEAGVNYFDTASNYGEGQSESFLGAGLGSRRNDAVIGTKFGVAVKGWEGSGGASPEYVRKATERSLRELDTDYIDLLMIHFPYPETPIEDTLGAMSALVDQGKVRHIGCSNFDPPQLSEALDVSSENGLARFVGNQVQYSMLHREPETSGLDQVCLDRGVGLLPFYPLGNGLLTGKTRRGEPPKGRLQMDRYQKFLTDENFDLVEGVEAFARARDLSMVEVALGWLLAQKAVPSVTPGATTAEQVASNVLAADWAPSSGDLAELEKVLGG